jgi:hypothetical protein
MTAAPRRTTAAVPPVNRIRPVNRVPPVNRIRTAPTAPRAHRMNSGMTAKAMAAETPTMVLRHRWAEPTAMPPRNRTIPPTSQLIRPANLVTVPRAPEEPRVQRPGPVRGSSSPGQPVRLSVGPTWPEVARATHRYQVGRS